MDNRSKERDRELLARILDEIYLDSLSQEEVQRASSESESADAIRRKELERLFDIIEAPSRHGWQSYCLAGAIGLFAASIVIAAVAGLTISAKTGGAEPAPVPIAASGRTTEDSRRLSILSEPHESSVASVTWISVVDATTGETRVVPVHLDSSL